MSAVDRSGPILYVRLFKPGTPAPLRVDVSERVTSFEYDDDETTANKTELSLDNYDLSVFDDPLWKKGNMLDIAWGYEGNMSRVREGVIQSITGKNPLKVVALAKSILMNKKQMNATFENKTRSDIARQIAEANGYGSDEQIIDDTEHVISHTVQARLTDAQFLKHLAQKEGFEFYVDFDGFHFHRRKMGQKPRRVFTYFTDGSGDLMDFNVLNDVTLLPGKVTAKGRDDLKKTDINAVADNASTKRDALAPQIEIIDPKTGESTIRYQAAESTILTNAKDSAAAKREADGRLIKAQQATVLMTASCIGDPQQSAKTVVEFRGISKRLSGKYYVSAVKHKVNPDGYTMELKVRSDGGHGTGTGTKTDGNLNKNAPGDAHALQPIERVDAKTGETSIRYRPAGG